MTGHEVADALPEVVVVGAASRDVAPEDRRGWRLGGAVTYGALMLARLGVRTGALVGVDPAASTATELDYLRDAGVDLRLVLLASGPVFENCEAPGGRRQLCLETGELLPIDAVPDGWADVPWWLLAPVADELSEAWANVPRPGSAVALGWQGLLRELLPGAAVRRRAPRDSRLVSRARIVALSRDDVDPGLARDGLLALLRPDATLLLTDADRGGERTRLVDGRPAERRRYPAIAADAVVDPTGAGDVFLAAYVAAAAGHPLGGSGRRGSDLRLAAAAASLCVEAPGLRGVPEMAELAARLERSLVTRRGEPPDPVA